MNIIFYFVQRLGSLKNKSVWCYELIILEMAQWVGNPGTGGRLSDFNLLMPSRTCWWSECLFQCCWALSLCDLDVFLCHCWVDGNYRFYTCYCACVCVCLFAVELLVTSVYIVLEERWISWVFSHIHDYFTVYVFMGLVSLFWRLYSYLKISSVSGG